MELTDVIRLLSEKTEAPGLLEAEKFLTDRTNSVKDIEEKASATYYLLRIKLLKHPLYETTEALALYEKLKKLVLQLEQEYWVSFRQKKNDPLELAQIKAFYNIVSYYFGSLETIYRGLNFDESVRKAFEMKMRLRQGFLLVKKQYLPWVGYKLAQLSSNYGNSFLQWLFTSMVIINLFALLYWIADQSVSIGGYVYHSVVSFTLLGFLQGGIDSPAHLFLTAAEAFIGFCMLGMFVTVMNRKF